MATERVALTQARVGRLAPPEQGRRTVYDTRTPGFAVRITANGMRSFIVYRKVRGRPQRVTIGRYPAIGVETARKEALRLNGKIAEGVDPMEARKAARGEMTLGQLWDQYLTRHAKQRKRTWKSDETRWNLYLKSWAGRPLSRIQRLDVQHLHGRIGCERGHYAANRLLALLSRMFNLANRWGYASENPAHGVERFHEVKRERFLQPAEAPRLFAAIQAEFNANVRDYVLVSLLTGARKANVLGMRWADVDLEGARWTIPGEQSKNREPMTLPLHGEVVAVLRERSDHTWDSPWVFPGPGRAGHMADPKKGWARILKRAKVKDLRLHDLRRTLGSWQAARGASLSIIGRSLGHRSTQAAAIYARLNLDPVRESVNGAVDALLVAGNVKEPAEVVPIARKRTRRRQRT